MFKNALPFVALALFIGLAVLVTRRTQAAQKRSRCTVGQVTGWTQTLKNGRDITYRCTIRGQRHTGSDHELPGMNTTVGFRYVVAFDSVDPARHWAYYDLPVPDSVGPPPPNGWAKAAFGRRSATWQRTDSARQARLGAQQDSLQLHWQQANK